MIQRDDKSRFSEMWDPAGDSEVPQDIYSKWSAELYGLLVTLTEREPHHILEGQSDWRVGIC
eukprot:2584829-Karenia_brevis.AAC.1